MYTESAMRSQCASGQAAHQRFRTGSTSVLPVTHFSSDPICVKKERTMLAIVTGASSGMGMATTAALADKGYTVIMLCRSEKRGKAACAELMQKEGRDIRLWICDLGSFESIQGFSRRFHEAFDSLDVLVNNAGFISLDRQETEDHFERQFGVNHLGHFLLTNLLLDTMKEGSRIVVVASGAHKAGKIHFHDINLEKGYNVVKAYGQSKLANVLFTRELAKRVKSQGITVNCCHPGAVATQMGVDRKTGFGKTIVGMLKPFFLTPEEGAATAVFLATAPSLKMVTGEYFYRCRIAKSSSRSKDMDLAKRLFEKSLEWTGLEHM